MQTTRSYQKIVLLMIMATQSACDKRQDFADAIAKHRNSLVDQVNTVGQDVPFYTTETLNPVWTLNENTPIVQIPKFELTDQNSNPRTESLFKDRLSLVGFMFASCTGFCPFLIEGMQSVEQELKKQGLGPVQFVAITVNPEEDSPERLKAYAEIKKLNDDWILLTGDKDTIYSLAKKTFASQVFKRKTQNANFSHSEHLYLIDGEGRLRGILNGTRVDLKRDARNLLSRLEAKKNPPTITR